MLGCLQAGRTVQLYRKMISGLLGVGRKTGHGHSFHFGGCTGFQGCTDLICCTLCTGCTVCVGCTGCKDSLVFCTEVVSCDKCHTLCKGHLGGSWAFPGPGDNLLIDKLENRGKMSTFGHSAWLLMDVKRQTPSLSSVELIVDQKVYYCTSTLLSFV